MAEIFETTVWAERNPVSVIPNGLDTGVFFPQDQQASRLELGLPRDQPLILFSALHGNAIAVKGWALLTEALRRVAVVMPRATLVVAGIPTTVNLDGLPLQSINFGVVAHDVTMARLYSAVDVSVVPSRFESFGQSASESLACGCPVVGFRVGGLRDIIDNVSDGYLAEPFDCEDLARGLIQRLEDVASRHLGAKDLADRAAARWSLEQIARRHLSAYEATLSL